ncbi:hypothetical protein GLOIN_2v813753 [Rhizophagus irregularis DAOM 181602=DAOM 197198]|nr:hypothetical protein GLOIN_2v813753 [Rhizophagus irregularis DAOM 181602=DAOM 197198]
MLCELIIFRNPETIFINWYDPNNLKNLSIHCDNVIYYVDYKILIQAIYQNCPNIRYLKLSLDRNLLIPEFENLLINCQCLNGLIINMCKDYEFSWVFNCKI